MHKISAIFCGVLFLLGCMTLGIAIFFSDILSSIFMIYLVTHATTFSDDILYINSRNFYFLAVAELILGAVGYFYHSKKAE
ncbi:hypothetical protein [Caproiciproducens faecalis]|uniref:Lipoprotein n=1 Tax=Caproiciproducens faecalis TaxID=2820301 RepID=A0ABS7DP38_9FIRM|nr:hypothetical protein [Caproiciproducens faecalis]MBW7572837.1 hypothetical protein [Caproiciproducens faecalis]